MTLAQRHGAVCIILLLFLPAVLRAGTRTPEESARQSVQSFYDWYVPQTHDAHRTAPWIVAVRQRPSWVRPQLLHALTADADAQFRAKGDLVGLDFDPFLDSQDPADLYQAEPARCQSGICNVPVFARGNGTGKPDVTAQVTWNAGRWRFINFQYADGRNLLQVLRALRAERTQRH